jgi:hypothetical protein
MIRFPSHRPKVSDVEYWDTLLAHHVDRTWKINQPQTITIQRGTPFPEFYRVRHVNHETNKKTSKLFYGESAHFAVERYVNDLGFANAIEL